MTRLRYLNLYTDLILLTLQIEDIAKKEEKSITDRREKEENMSGKREKPNHESRKNRETVGGKKRETHHT